VTALDFSHVELGDELRSGTGSLVFAARDKRDGAPLLVTCTGYHRVIDVDELAFDGFAPLVGAGHVAGHRWDDAVVERLPEGARPASTNAPMPEAALMPLAAALARAVARAHAEDVVINGIVPELVYAAGDGAFAALAPRGPKFIGTAPKLSGFTAYAVPYIGHDVLVLGKPATAATDSFALCATVFAIGTGHHPFGDGVREIMTNIMRDAPTPWPGSSAVGDLLRRGLARDPSERPSAAELAAAFAAVGK
jgi:hypothetical protein